MDSLAGLAIAFRLWLRGVACSESLRATPVLKRDIKVKCNEECREAYINLARLQFEQKISILRTKVSEMSFFI
jgi:hypothetical protein